MRILAGFSLRCISVKRGILKRDFLTYLLQHRHSNNKTWKARVELDLQVIIFQEKLIQLTFEVFFQQVVHFCISVTLKTAFCYSPVLSFVAASSTSDLCSALSIFDLWPARSSGIASPLSDLSGLHPVVLVHLFVLPVSFFFCL